MKRGISLIEMIIALTFITVAFFPLISSMISNIRVSQDTDGTLQAVNLGSKKIEELLIANYAVVSTEAKAAIAQYPGYFRETLVTEEVVLKSKTMKVTIFWKNGPSETTYSIYARKINL